MLSIGEEGCPVLHSQHPSLDLLPFSRDLWMGMNATDPRSRAPTNFLPSELEFEPNTEVALAAEPSPWSHFNDTKSFLISVS